MANKQRLEMINTILTPSLSDTILNKIKLKEKIKEYNTLLAE